MRLFVDNLTNVDFSYLCPERGLVGETWLASVELTGPLDDQGMVCDFGTVKKHLRHWFDDTLDHKLLTPENNPACRLSTRQGETTVAFADRVHLVCPEQAVVSLPLEVITAQALARWCESQLQDVFEFVDKLSVRFDIEAIDGPYYHYSHGLRKHQGNCQRIAHGHRSKILIWKNEQPDTEAMHAWAARWQDIYLANRADCLEQASGVCRFEYLAPQGKFSLTLPADRCDFLNTDTTVEQIAQHIADTLAAANPGHHYRVKAFEGISKGAIAEAGSSKA